MSDAVPAEGWPEGVDPTGYVRPDGSRILYDDGGRSEAARPVQQAETLPDTDISNTFIGKLAQGKAA